MPKQPIVYPKVLEEHPLGAPTLQAQIQQAIKVNRKERPDKDGYHLFRKEDAALIEAVIKAEPLLIGGAPSCRSAGHCAGAALYFAVGTPHKYLNEMDLTFQKVPLKYHQRLFDAFRVDSDLLSSIVDANDENEDDRTITLDDVVYMAPTKQQQRARRGLVFKTVRSYIGLTVARP